MKSAVQSVMLEVGLSLLSCEYVASPVLCLGDILGYLFVHLFVCCQGGVQICKEPYRCHG